MFKKSLRVYLASCLIARLEWALEVSKLAILQFRPPSRIDHVRKTHSPFDDGVWVCTQDKDYYVHLEPGGKNAKIRSLPERVYN